MRFANFSNFTAAIPSVSISGKQQSAAEFR